jgi:hypothetical protein
MHQLSKQVLFLDQAYLKHGGSSSRKTMKLSIALLWIRNSRFYSGSGNGLLTLTRKLRILRSAHSGFTVFTYVQNVLVKECPVNPEEVQMHPVML